ncbi:E3 ubiquitin-protein ligase HECTD3-like isoform X1 [Alligator sinensis]|uniref:E3 ubiquitin-protein ligase HECTD3-like isoform X1 n=2 Tax=Alligator sinensis TaxID=38654 RepID=A0A3Q0GRY9_ALLSI|nr:E3 ubiquitin-protein ligase HECTD3-like isoform X1 [Alligator sinensis]
MGKGRTRPLSFKPVPRVIAGLCFLLQEQLAACKGGCELKEGWVLVRKHGEDWDRLILVDATDEMERRQQLFGVDYHPAMSWEQVVDLTSLPFAAKPRQLEQDEDAVQKFRFVPPTWSFECDEDLVRFMYDYFAKGNRSLGRISQYVDSIDVSSYVKDHGVSHLTDNQQYTYWESDGGQGEHWVRLTMKKGTLITKLVVTIEPNDASYSPKRIAVYGGVMGKLKKLADFNIKENCSGDVCLLRDMLTHQPVIEIRILECREHGLNVRLWGLKIKAAWHWDVRLNADMFQSAHLVRYPRLEGTDPDLLYRRAVLIQRFMKLLDSVLPYLFPVWDPTVSLFNELKHIKQFLLLSKWPQALASRYLKESETKKPNNMPELFINRHLALKHRENPGLDPSCRNAIFTQVYKGLKSFTKEQKPLDYRWPSSYDQWWECKFVGEGICDCGGGFRDSLTDISEELCPSSGDGPVPLPFFVRTSNQGNSTGEARDMYIPNPSCKDFAKYEWIGQIMGAALRGKEFLVLALPGFVWKQLTGEEVSWTKDFVAVDSVLVKFLEAVERMDRETFESEFGNELTYTTVLSDQRTVELIPNGSRVVVRYEDREEFVRLVRTARLEESTEQIAALQAGLLRVVPQTILDFITWQQLEKKVCGDPEVTVEALKNFTQFDDMEPSDTRIQCFWEALTNFTNEDRSRFLRFVSGRSRLPVSIHISPHMSMSDVMDVLPEVSTCSSTLFLPQYTSAKVCEEKLRYAAYNCVSIDRDRDADMDMWAM